MPYDIEKFINLALQEDIVDYEGKIPSGDHTSLACIPGEKEGSAQLLCKASGVIAGVELAEIIFRKIDTAINFQKIIIDGIRIKPGDIAFKVTGELKSILLAER